MTLPGVPPPQAALAEGFAQHVRRWSARRGASERDAAAAAHAAHALSLATSQGHVGLRLVDLAPLACGPATVGAWRQALHASGVVSLHPAVARPEALPLVLDAGDRLYLLRHFDLERRLARRLARALVQAGHGPVPDAPTHDDDPQALAVALAPHRRLTIVSGGPGTGKTHAVVAMLARMLDARPGARIVLAAPTGKAAARMVASIRAQLGTLPEAVRARLPAHASTIHRLLGSRADGRFLHGAAYPLPLDLLVVDEASMLDLALATQLLEAVPEKAQVVLLGDKDQLAAVEAGAVFAELCLDPSLRASRAPADVQPGAAAAGAPAPPLHALPRYPSVVWLTRSRRFDPDAGIGRLARLVHQGDAEAVRRWPGNPADSPAGAQADPAAARPTSPAAEAGAVAIAFETGATPGPVTLEWLHEGYRPYLDAVRHHGVDPAEAHRVFESFRVLCALREGPRGVAGINAAWTRRMRTELGPADRAPSTPWFPGRPVLIVRNDPALGLANGDIGLTLADADGRLAVHFPGPEGSFLALSTAGLPPHETAFAMTIHKAQGSEFDRVLVLLPAQPGRGLTREGLYTAITRARRAVMISAGPEALANAIRTPTRRVSGLRDRLAEALARETAQAPSPAQPHGT